MKIINSHYIPLPEPRWLIMTPQGDIYEQVGTLTVVEDASTKKGEYAIKTYSHPVVGFAERMNTEEDGDKVNYMSTITTADGDVLDDVLLKDCTRLCPSKHRVLTFIQFNTIVVKLMTRPNAEDIDLEDLTNHAIVVTHIEDGRVTIFDPYEEPYISIIPMSDFLNAWKESHNYMIQVFQSADEYEPHPINVDSIPLGEDLEELIEAIAENAHDIWAEKMMKDGWTYGKDRDEQKKQDPCILPYTALPDDEKEYDRLMAYNTIKLVKKLGYGSSRKQN
jgi:hypothetical protein